MRIPSKTALKKKVLFGILFLARLLGCFYIARRLTAGSVRILCYHGAALDNENAFRGGLFVTPALFESRMDYLHKRGYPVVTLDEALEGLYGNATLPSCATVITIDDGWLGTATKMADILQRFSFPATLYLSTYYVAKQTQVFGVAVDYVLWSAEPQTIDLRLIDSRLSGTFATNDQGERTAASEALWRFADTLPTAADRQALLKATCGVVGLDIERITAPRLLSFMNDDEVRATQSCGVDVQLHTHRHQFPDDDPLQARAEIEDNRQYLQKIVANDLVHFCYPSGEYDTSQFPLLEELGIRSATTTKGGFNTPKTHRFEMTRFLDSEYVTALEFEAEMSGFFELIRRCGYSI